MSKKEIYDLISKFSVFFVPNPSIEKIKAYSEALALDNFTTEQVNFVLNNYARKSKFFPSLSDFYEPFTANENETDHANELAGKIISCIGDFGPWRSDEVKEHVGKLGWDVVENFGGWQLICNITNDQIPTVRAQLRDLAKWRVKKSIVSDNLALINNNPDGQQRQKSLEELNFKNLV